MSKKILEMEGSAVCEDRDRGFLPATVLIDGEDVLATLWEVLTGETADFDVFYAKPEGRYRITVEKLD